MFVKAVFSVLEELSFLNQTLFHKMFFNKLFIIHATTHITVIIYINKLFYIDDNIVYCSCECF